MSDKVSTIELEVPKEVKEVVVYACVPCPQDGDSQRRVCVKDATSDVPGQGEEYFEQGTESCLREEEESLVQKLLWQLMKMGFVRFEFINLRECEGYSVHCSR